MTYKSKRDQAASSHRSYERNKVKMKERALAYTRGQRIRLAEIVRQAKSKPCMDCGNEYPTWVMDLDHRNPKEKVLAVATAVTWGWSIQRPVTGIGRTNNVWTGYSVRGQPPLTMTRFCRSGQKQPPSVMSRFSTPQKIDPILRQPPSQAARFWSNCKSGLDSL
jgi:hypothetical protein